jgi:hypothetical protein
MRRMLLGAGCAALLAGTLAIASGVMTTGGAYAGETAPPCDSTSTPTNTATSTATATVVTAGRMGSGEIVYASFPQGNGPVIPTCTPTRPARTHTPTPSRTPEDTATPPPSTPTNTPVPQGTPSGGAIEPPNTGTGDDGGGMNIAFIAAGAALVLLGGAGIGLGLKQR